MEKLDRVFTPTKVLSFWEFSLFSNPIQGFAKLGNDEKKSLALNSQNQHKITDTYKMGQKISLAKSLAKTAKLGHF